VLLTGNLASADILSDEAAMLNRQHRHAAVRSLGAKAGRESF